MSYVRPEVVAVGGPLWEQMASFASQSRLGTLRSPPSGVEQSATEVNGHALTVSWERDNWTAKAITGYRDASEDKAGKDFGAFPADGRTVLSSSFRPVPAGTMLALFDAGWRRDFDQFSQELQLVGNALDDKLEYTVGLYYFEESGTDYGYQNYLLTRTAFPTLPAGITLYIENPHFDYGSDVKSKAVYGQFKYRLTDKFSATLGMRHTKDDKEAWLTNAGSRIDRAAVSKDWSNFNPSLTLEYRLNENMNTYPGYCINPADSLRQQGLSGNATARIERPDWRSS